MDDKDSLGVYFDDYYLDIDDVLVKILILILNLILSWTEINMRE